MTPLTAIISAVATIIVALLVYAGVRVTANAARQAANGTTSTEGRRVELEGYRSLLADYRTEIEGIPNLRAEINSLRDRQLADHGRMMRIEEQWHLAIGYIRLLFGRLAQYEEPPAPPEGLDFDHTDPSTL